MHQHTAKTLSCIVLLAFSLSVYALPDDKTKIARLKANYADLNQSSRQGEFVGDVIIEQGTTFLYADKATTKSDDKNKLILAIAYGSPDKQAHYLTQTDSKKPLMHAFADEIHYHPNLHRIDLIGHARVEQGKNILKANKISYDTINQRVLSESAGKERVSITIHPEK